MVFLLNLINERTREKTTVPIFDWAWDEEAKRFFAKSCKRYRWALFLMGTLGIDLAEAERRVSSARHEPDYVRIESVQMKGGRVVYEEVANALP